MKLDDLPSLTEEQRVKIRAGLDEAKKPVRIRFTIIEANRREYEDYYRHRLDTYVPIHQKKNIRGMGMGARLLLMIPDVGKWREFYLAQNGGYNCLQCEDTGVKHLEDRWIPCLACSLGKTVNNYFYVPKTRERKIYET